jgi:DNA-binding NarL/FixJ family response regulator
MQIPGDRKLNFEPNFTLKSSLLVVQDKVQYRQKKILELRGKGFSNVEISEQLRYSLSTVEKDIQKLRRGIVN